MPIKKLTRKARDRFAGEADRAVSPVIGVVVMVAITVVLAAVIGAFALGLGGNINQEAQSGDEITNDSAGGYTVT